MDGRALVVLSFENLPTIFQSFCRCGQILESNAEDGRTAPGVCGNGSVPLSHSENVVTRFGIHIHESNAARMKTCNQ